MAYLMGAVRELGEFTRDIRCSRIFESAALLPADATPEMNMPFLNMAVSARCELEPLALLEKLKQIETALGRQKRGFWGPREIDMDILAIDAVVLESDELNVPHKELLNRDFAIFPLMDVAPKWHYPVAGEFLGKTPADIIRAKGYMLGKQLHDTGCVIND